MAIADPCQTERNHVEELKYQLQADQQRLSTVSRAEKAALIQEIKDDLANLQQAQKDLDACIADVFPEWSLEAWAPETNVPFSDDVKWDLPNEEGNEGRIRTSVFGLNVDPPGTLPPLAELVSLVEAGAWCIPPGQQGTVSVQYHLEQSAVVALDLIKVLVSGEMDPNKIASKDFLKKYAVDGGFIMGDSYFGDTGNKVIALPGPGMYMLLGATPPVGQSSGWAPGPVLVVTYHVDAFLCHGPNAVQPIVSGTITDVGVPLVRELASGLQLPTSLAPQNGGVTGATKYQVSTLGQWDVEAGGGFVLTDFGEIPLPHHPRRFDLFFTGTVSKDVNARKVWPVEPRRPTNV